MFKNLFKRKYYKLTLEENEIINKLVKLTDIDRYSIKLDINSVNEEFIEYYNYIITIKNTNSKECETRDGFTKILEFTDTFAIEYQSDGYIKITCDGVVILDCDITNNKDIHTKLGNWIDVIKNNINLKENNKIKLLITKFLQI